MALRAKQFSRLYTWHRIAGLYLLPHLLVLMVTGTILVFRHELGPEKKTFTEAAILPEKYVPLQAIFDASLKLYPRDVPVAFDFDHDNDRLLTVRMGLDGSKAFKGARRVLFDRATGEHLDNDKPKTEHWTEFVLRLHREFLLGFYGKLYVSWIGLVFAFVLVAGFIVYGPLMKRRSFGSMRISSPKRWNRSDIHKTFGMSIFAWCLLMGLTGLFLGLSGQLLKVFQATTLKKFQAQSAELDPSQAVLSIDAALKKAQELLPEGHLSFIALPDTQFATPRHYIFVLDGAETWNERLSQLVLVDAVDPDAKAQIQELPWYLQALVLSEPLHFGDYGGLALKIIWSILGVASLILPLSGFSSYLQKRKQKKAKQRGGEIILPVQLGAAFARPYLLPCLMFVLSLSGLIGALLLDGILDSVAIALLALPLAILGFLAFAWKSGGRTLPKKTTIIPPRKVS